MNPSAETTGQLGPFQGGVAEPFRAGTAVESLVPLLDDFDAAPGEWVSQGADAVKQIVVEGVALAVKRFQPRGRFRQSADAAKGGAAERSFRFASLFLQHGIATPPPVAYLERRTGRWMGESFYVSVFEPGLVTFRDELIRIYRRQPLAAPLLERLQWVASAARAMHQAGLQHGDLGNQNMLLDVRGASAGPRVRFVDLNRCRDLGRPLAADESAADLCRIHLPSDLLRIFQEMYFDGPIDPVFARAEEKRRRAYARHTGTRLVRHPVRTRRRRRDADPATQYPSDRDLWIWDDRSAQPINTVRRPERKKLLSKKNHLCVLSRTLAAAPEAYRRYRSLLDEAFTAKVAMANRVGMAVEPAVGTEEQTCELLAELGPVPTLLRFYHHEGRDGIERKVRLLQRLRSAGHRVSIALVQDRKAVKQPQAWATFAEEILACVHGQVDLVELGHAVNRVKWGVWDLAEYQRMMEAVAHLPGRYPNVRWTGPAAIDFEYQYLASFLKALPKTFSLHALSHHLYVDRRGAPENRQGRFSALEKFALARALAWSAPGCEDRLVISEVNWPLQDGGVFSPVGSPYLYPGQKLAAPPSATEEEYADYMVRYLLIALCSGFVSRVYWWRLVHRGFGLVDDSDPNAWRKRPAFHALKAFLDAVGTSTFQGKLAAPAGVELFAFGSESGGEGQVIGYTPGEPVDYKPAFEIGGGEEAPQVVLTGRPCYFRVEALRRH